MGVISSALNSALENLGRATMDVGNNGLLAGYSVWKKCCKITTDYLKVSPVTGGGNAWSIVTGNLFNISMSLECLAPVVQRNVHPVLRRKRQKQKLPRRVFTNVWEKRNSRVLRRKQRKLWIRQ